MNQQMRLMRYQRELNDRLGTGRDHWGLLCGEGSGWRQFAEQTFRTPQVRLRASPVTLAWAKQRSTQGAQGLPAIAWAQHNRWVATCECAGQEVVDPNEPQFYCFGCFNIDNDGYPRPVEFPPERVAIEAALLLRPDPMNRNWFPAETVMDLHKENEDHGIKKGKI